MGTPARCINMSKIYIKRIIKIRSRQHEHTSQCDGPAWLTSERGAVGSWFPFLCKRLGCRQFGRSSRAETEEYPTKISCMEKLSLSNGFHKKYQRPYKTLEKFGFVDVGIFMRQLEERFQVQFRNETNTQMMKLPECGMTCHSNFDNTDG
jgi:hypothetical protein